jgi:hypothetical protein
MPSLVGRATTKKYYIVNAEVRTVELCAAVENLRVPAIEEYLSHNGAL